jgi:hypothetical protein
MERLGQAPQIVHVEAEGWDFEGVGYAHGLRPIAGRGLPSNTVLCSNDRLAIGFLAAAHERGMRVGRGPGFALRVAGHDDHPRSRSTCPALTTPGTRASTCANAKYLTAAPFAKTVQTSILAANPADATRDPVPCTGVQFVVIPEFQGIGNYVGRQTSAALAGQQTVDQALKNSQVLAVREMTRAGYIK